jgi:succinyl-CoA synthetase beta subunit
VNSIEEANQQLLLLFAKDVKGYPVEKILIEEEVIGLKELYLSFTVNRQERAYSILAGTIGGVDIEETAKLSPETILKIEVSPLRAVSNFDSFSVSKHLGVPLDKMNAFMQAMFAFALSMDAELVEFNPLVLTEAGLVILDSKVTVDDNSLFRHPAIKELPPRGESQEEVEAAKWGLTYVSLDGDIGIIGNGAGLTMATMDLLKSEGGSPANFLDSGAGASSDKFKRGMLFLMNNVRVRAILVNIFGGLTRCDEVAYGIVEAFGASAQKKPVVVRFAGTNEREGKQILKNAGIDAFSEPLDAVKRVIELAGGSQ